MGHFNDPFPGTQSYLFHLLQFLFELLIIFGKLYDLGLADYFGPTGIYCHLISIP